MEVWVKTDSANHWRCPYCNEDFIFTEKNYLKYSFCPSCGKLIDTKHKMKYLVKLWFCIDYEVEAYNLEEAEDAALTLFDIDCMNSDEIPFDIPNKIEVEEIK